MAIEPLPVKLSDFVRLEFGRVVDEEGQRADGRDGGRHQAQHRIVIGEVGGDDRGAAALAGESGAQFFGCRP